MTIGAGLLVERHPRTLVEYRADTPDGRRFWARVLNYGVKDSYGTAFRPGLFNAQLDRGDYPPLLYGHDWMSLANVLGRAIDHDDTAAGLDLRFRLDVEENPLARQAADQLRSGTLSEFSIGFTREDDRPRPDLGVIEVTEAYLDEVSVVPRGAVPGTALLSMRKADHDRVMTLAAPEQRRKALAALARDDRGLFIPAVAAGKILTDLRYGRISQYEAVRRMEAAGYAAEAGELEAEADKALARLAERGL
jgi:HK97 family phage prohead protease